MKQTKLRRKRVFRYAVLYFILLIVFVGLIVAPTVAGPMIGEEVFPEALSDFKLVQPSNQDNNDTTAEPTGGSPGEDEEEEEEDDLFDRVKFLVI